MSFHIVPLNKDVSDICVSVLEKYADNSQVRRPEVEFSVNLLNW